MSQPEDKSKNQIEEQHAKDGTFPKHGDTAPLTTEEQSEAKLEKVINESEPSDSAAAAGISHVPNVSSIDPTDVTQPQTQAPKPQQKERPMAHVHTDRGWEYRTAGKPESGPADIKHEPDDVPPVGAASAEIARQHEEHDQQQAEKAKAHADQLQKEADDAERKRVDAEERVTKEKRDNQ